jgi:hypothetical protein
MVVTELPGVGRPTIAGDLSLLYFVDKPFYTRKEKMRSAGFEPAIPSLGSSYLDQAGLTSLRLAAIQSMNRYIF